MAENYTIIKCSVHQLRPGLELGESVFSPDGSGLLHAGTILTEKQIARMLNYGLDSVRIRQTVLTPEVITETAAEAYCEPDMAAGVSAQESEFSDTYNRSVQDMKKCFSLIKLERQLDYALLDTLVDSVARLASRGIAVTALLHTLTRAEDYLVHHSVNVGILANIIGELSGVFSVVQQRNLILAGILHDIGKLDVSSKVLYKNGALTEEELAAVRQHPAIAFKFLSRYKEIPESVRLGVLQHHERDDGSGYPLHTDAAKNHPIAKVLGIADVYDAMTSKKVYGQEVSPFAAIDTIQADTFASKFSPDHSTPFLHELCQTLIGRYVTLSDGRTGQLVFWNRSGKENCLVRFSDGKILDVRQQQGLKLAKLVC